MMSKALKISDNVDKFPVGREDVEPLCNTICQPGVEHTIPQTFFSTPTQLTIIRSKTLPILICDLLHTHQIHRRLVWSNPLGSLGRFGCSHVCVCQGVSVSQRGVWVESHDEVRVFSVLSTMIDCCLVDYFGVARF